MLPPELADKFSYSYVTDVNGYRAIGSLGEVNWHFGDGSGLSLSLANEPKTTVFTTRCPAETGTRTVPLIVARQQGRQCQFLALLFPYKG